MRVRIVGALAQPLKQILECAPDYDLTAHWSSCGGGLDLLVLVLPFLSSVLETRGGDGGSRPTGMRVQRWVWHSAGWGGEASHTLGPRSGKFCDL